MKIKVVYGLKQVAESGCDSSPSAEKPKLFAEYLQKDPVLNQYIEFVEPIPLTVTDFDRCHDKKFVREILSLKRKNGFGTFSQSVVDSLPYTNGAMYLAAELAIQTKQPTCALVSGFHHAGYNGFEHLGYFCTFNGLMIAATKLVQENVCKRVSIVDCDMHWGNGTDDILSILNSPNVYQNISFGRVFQPLDSGARYLDNFKSVKSQLQKFKPNVILYQSGADVHINDPYGGMLTEEEMYKRDMLMFSIAKELNISIAWNLAGGYQRDKDGGCSYVLKLHGNTFQACQEIYREQTIIE